MISITALNLMDTITNLVFLLVVLSPLYMLPLDFVVSNFTMPTLPTFYPAIKVKVNGHLRIITLRNPITNGWLFTLTLSRKVPTTVITTDSNTLTVKSFANPYRFAMGCLALFALTACMDTTSPDSRKGVQIFADHPKACLEMFPVVPDTIVKGLEKWSLKVNTDSTKPRETVRNRCVWVERNEWAECDSKSRAPSEETLADTVYAIDRICPATIKARTELGGD